MKSEGPNRELGARLSGAVRSEYWRSLEELSGANDFLHSQDSEFPEGASEFNDSLGRRRFLKLMGASLAMAGAQGCVSGPPTEDIVPYVDQSERIVPGRPSFYATAFPFRGFALGILAESHEGRPTKIEGNPDHPASLGGTNVFMQASVLGLYDPNRSQTVLLRGNTATADEFYTSLQERLRRSGDGDGVRILTEKVTSPTLANQLSRFFDRYPSARWHTHEAVSGHDVEEGLELAFGEPRTPLYHIENADVIVALDSDFLFALAGSLQYARSFARRRRVREDAMAMNRLYAVESTATITGATADHRLPLRPSDVERFVRALGARIGVGGTGVDLDGRAGRWLDALVADLQEHTGRSLVVAGEALPPELHALTHHINERLQNTGATVSYITPVDARPEGGHSSLEQLVDDMESGTVDTLIMFGGNPVYTAPGNLPFAEVLERVPMSAHLSLHRDETSMASAWHLPRTHYLEDWSDLRAFDGTVSIMQPLLAPLYDTCLSEHDLAGMMLGEPGVGAYETVRETWRGRLGGDFEQAWRNVLRLGIVPGTGAMSSVSDSDAGRAGTPVGSVDDGASSPTVAVADTADTFSDASIADTSDQSTEVVEGGNDLGGATDTAIADTGTPSFSGERDSRETPAEGGSGRFDDTIEVVFRPDPTVWDGSYATNNWLQELPKPITKLVWDNAVLMAPDLAERAGIENEQAVEVSVDGRSVTGAAFIVPGHPDHTLTLYLGYGRSHAGDVSGNGFSAYHLRSTAAEWSARGATMHPLDDTWQLVTTQHHHSMEGRKLVEEAPIRRFRENPDFIHEGEPEELPTLLPEYDYPRNRWGMTIDLNVCIGCNACITACQAENNIPVVGKDEVRRGREMHWLRVDRYYKGPRQNPEAFFQPVPCMHCEKAPCEVVCPVYATVHDSEGLNVMIYNRCIGTRYCSNNCPYKVRRFNFLEYSDWSEDVESLQKNPDVTVRSRGVMEKCTYCVQRISAARIRAKKEDREIRDGEVRTACQMACPTEAIVFGDLAKEDSHVHLLEKQPHNYKLLREQGTRPRTSYLAHFRSRNESVPEIDVVESRIGQTERLEVQVGPGDE